MIKDYSSIDWPVPEISWWKSRIEEERREGRESNAKTYESCLRAFIKSNQIKESGK